MGDDAAEAVRYGLRKRRRVTTDDDCSNVPAPLAQLLTLATTSKSVVIFSGSGLSATSGMSTFSTQGGLYERAQRMFKLQDGKTLFTYTFFDRNRVDALAFFTDIYSEACNASAAPGHDAIHQIYKSGRLQRHYTMNIDGLAERVGMSSWHPKDNADAPTVEMHGNIHNLVCVECGSVVPLDAGKEQKLREKTPVFCDQCPMDETTRVKRSLRFKVMLYEDADSEVITPEEVMDLMEEDTKAADLVLWVGISFQQSASTAYFRKVRRWLQEVGKAEKVVQVVINPSDEAMWNLLTASSNLHELNVLEVLGTADDILPAVAELMKEPIRNQGIAEEDKCETSLEIDLPLHGEKETYRIDKQEEQQLFALFTAERGNVKGEEEDAGDEAGGVGVEEDEVARCGDEMHETAVSTDMT